jgi:hypothetical protein
VLERLAAEIRIAGYVGPTVFTSEARDGRTLAAFDPAVIDPAALRDDDSFWPTFLESLA